MLNFFFTLLVGGAWVAIGVVKLVVAIIETWRK